jgi:hypothetical protein
VAGTWTENIAIRGASLVLTVDGSANGMGTYAIEAGRSGTVQVAGRLTGSTVVLRVQYDYGPLRTFTGSLSDADHLSGMFDDGGGTVVFLRE